MYHFIKVDITQPIAGFTVEDYLFQNENAYTSSYDSFDNYANIIFSKDKSFLKKFANTFKLEPKMKLNHKKIVCKICEDLGYEYDELMQAILKDDVFVNIEIFNKVTYKKLLQLLASAMAYNNFFEVRKEQIVVMFDDDTWKIYKNLSITYIIDQYLLDIPIKNSVYVPLYGTFAQKIKGYRK